MKGIGSAVIMYPQKRAQKSIHAIELYEKFYKDAFLLYIVVYGCGCAALPALRALLCQASKRMQIQAAIVMKE